MNETDRKILNMAQDRFPVCSRPFKHFADELGIPEEEVVQRLKKLKDSGIIRRIGGVFDSRKLGYTNCLIAARVPEERLDEVARYINTFPGVTHNYERTRDLNLWFTLSAGSQERFDEIITLIKEHTGVTDIRLFPAVRVFQSKVRFVL